MTIDANGEIRLNGVQATLDDPSNNTRIYITENNGILTFRVYVKELDLFRRSSITKFTEKCKFTLTKEQYEHIGQRLFK